jgi:hypothetical protein
LPAVPLGYSPIEAVAERPHVMVDGAPRPGAVVTLSHWPQSPTPRVLARDLSVEMALEYARYALGLVSSRRHDETATFVELLALGRTAEAVTNDHFDEDGLLSVVALVDPEMALEHEALVVAAASCGDFGVLPLDPPGLEEAAAEVAFAIGPLAEQEAGTGAGTSQRYLAVLPRVGDLLANPASYAPFWHEEMQLYRAGRLALERGAVTCDTDPALDLACVRRLVPQGVVGAAGGLPVHAAAVHSATPATRVLTFDGAKCELYLRYESWIRFVSRSVPLRPDLTALAGELTALEPGSVTWEANGVGSIVCRMRPDGTGETELAPEVIEERVRAYLLTAPGAFDPFAAGGPYVGPSSGRAGGVGGSRSGGSGAAGSRAAGSRAPQDRLGRGSRHRSGGGTRRRRRPSH